MDTTICEDTEFTEIFSGINVVNGINFTGDIRLNSDSSLVRILFTDQFNDEFIIHESYPLIVEDTAYSIALVCDETCYLNSLVPYSVRVDIIDAVVDISYFTLDTIYQPNLLQLQYEFKRKYDSLKIIHLNQNIPIYDMDWVAGSNSTVKKYYKEKKEIFGVKYNIGGYDYYIGGIFEIAWAGPSHYSISDLVDNFDWRSRHGATNPFSPYYDNDELGTGWVTKVKNQDSCGACGVFSTVGLVETYINLLYNQHLDFDLSEQDIICHVGQGCDGISTWSALTYMKDTTGISTEYCFPYGITDDTAYCNYYQASCLDNNPDTLINIISDSLIYYNSSPDSIIRTLINNGLLNVEIGSETAIHSVALNGYLVDPADSSIIWIYKNSYGLESQGVNGFVYTKNLNIAQGNPLCFITGDINITCYEPPDTLCLDLDNDGYCNWGIGEKPLDCECENELPDCDDSNPALGPFDENYYCSCLLSYNSEPEYITVDTTWNQGQIIPVDHDIIIDSSGKLTIRGNAYFVENAKIIVEPGGELIIDGGLLTRACNQYWEGIEVWGNPSLSQFYKQNQGFVSVINDGRIEFAKVGISTSKKANGRYQPGFEGGIIHAIESSFVNNIIDIEFLPYQNIHPNVPGYEINNFSLIRKCNFITSFGDLYEFEMPDKHISIKSVKGIRINGCIFEFVNPIYDVISEDSTGIGIYYENACVIIENYCDGPVFPPTYECANVVPTIFKNLRYGIRATNTGEPRKFDVREIQFINNFAGIYISNYHQATILSNEIDVKYAILGDDGFHGGIYLEECSGYHIEDNLIHANYQLGYGSDKELVGIYIKDSGPDDNEIYNNVLHHLEFALAAEGQNKGKSTGLCLKCNTMYQNMNDIFAIDANPSYTPLVPLGIKAAQGADTSLQNAKAGNRFTNFPANGNIQDLYYWNYLNNAEHINYYHHQRNTDPLTYPADNNYFNSTTILRVEDDELEFIDSLACPSKINNGGSPLKSGADPKQFMDDAQAQITYYQSQLEAMVDGGDTENLNIDVVMSTPDEGLALKEQLMDESPYLSDTVMMQAIYKENVLPNAMVRDVLSANPQSAKSGKVLDALDDRFVQMPGYMMEDVMEGLNQVGAKEILESKLAYWQQEREFYKNEVIRHYITDTSIVSPIDSLIVFYLQEDDLASQYRLAFSYLTNNQAEDAHGVISSIPQSYELTNYQLALNDDYQQYFEIMQTMHDSSWMACQIDSVYVDLLIEIMDHGYPLICGYARNLLIHADQLEYTETVNLPIISQTQSHTFYDPSSEPESKMDYLKVFPNPAWDYVIVEFNTVEFNTSGLILITDMNGRFIKSVEVQPAHNQITINLGNLAKGIYHVTLYMNDEIIDTEKITIYK